MHAALADSQAERRRRRGRRRLIGDKTPPCSAQIDPGGQIVFQERGFLCFESRTEQVTPPKVSHSHMDTNSSTVPCL